MTAKQLELTDREKRLVQQSLRAMPPKNVFHHTFRGKQIRFGYFADTHMGEKHFHEQLWRAMVDTFNREGIVHVYGAGDILEGMSGRPGHIYELSHIGCSAQLAYAQAMFALAPTLKFHIITGN